MNVKLKNSEQFSEMLQDVQVKTNGRVTFKRVECVAINIPGGEYPSWIFSAPNWFIPEYFLLKCAMISLIVLLGSVVRICIP